MSYLATIFRKLRGAKRDDGVALPVDGNANAVIPGESVYDATASIEAGNAALRQNDSARALECFAAVLRVRHADADAHFGMGMAHYRLNEFVDASDCLQMAVHFRPGFAEAHNLLGACMLRRGGLEEAVRAFSTAVELMPGCALFHSDLGYVLLRECGEFERGSAHIRTALALDDANQMIWCNYCMVLWHEGRLDEMIAVCERLIAKDPGDQEAMLNRSLALLKQGRFAEAWPGYESRKSSHSNYLPRPYDGPEWHGETLNGKTVLVCDEQGLGDEIMFASCIPDLMQRAEHCVIECSPRLELLFRRSFPAATVLGVPQSGRSTALLGTVRPIDYIADAGSLPGFFRRHACDFPRHQGYLRADDQRIRHWRTKMDALGAGLKVGVAWRGGAVSTRRALRSMDLADLLPVLKTPDMHFVSLQHDADEAEISAIAGDAGVVMHQWPDALREFDETAALICALDLVVTVCTATVHLAGALGRRTWVMVPAIAEWRYLENGASMPWYPAVRMYRQRQAGTWRPVVDEVVTDLSKLRSA